MKENTLKVMKNRIFSKLRQAFTITNNLALTVQWENVSPGGNFGIYMYTINGGHYNPMTSRLHSSPNTSTTTETTSLNPVSQAPDNFKAKWVKNLSSKPLDKAQISLLALGPSFTAVP